MRRDSGRRGRPPWWPAGEPWPPQRGFGMHHRARAQFFRRIALAAVLLVVLAVAGMFAAAWIISSRLGLVGWAATIPAVFMMFAAAVVLVVMFRAMHSFASPLGAVMEAADRVADGDYAVRVQEHGPPTIRALARSFNTMTERLQNADRLRRDLMADVAHELRTPLSIVQGRLEGLMDGIYPRDDRQLSQLLEETHVLSRLIEDLRTLVLSDAGVLQLQKESTDMVVLVQDVVRSMQTETDRKSLSLSVTTSTDTAVLELDPVRIREVLTNLLSNAVRHTAAGHAVTIDIRNTNEGVAVAVTDTGEGMPPEEIAHIFDRFYKGSASRGSGLGLTIAKSIVTAHGGEISASSQINHGTSVTFTLPRSLAG